MKKTILILTKVVLALSINAQIIALHSSTETQLFKGISALTDAYNTARNGDTLYLSGHTFNAPAIFSKQLIIFGTGHHVDSTLATGKTFINGNIVLQEEADFFYIEGVEITSNFTLQNNTSVNNVIVKRCKINGTFNVLGDLSNPSSNLSLIENVILGRINLENARNAILSNNIIVNTFQSSNGNFINNNIVL